MLASIATGSEISLVSEPTVKCAADSLSAKTVARLNEFRALRRDTPSQGSTEPL